VTQRYVIVDGPRQNFDIALKVQHVNARFGTDTFEGFVEGVGETSQTGQFASRTVDEAVVVWIATTNRRSGIGATLHLTQIRAVHLKVVLGFVEEQAFPLGGRQATDSVTGTSIKDKIK
jgi:hypothetical protein